MQQHIDKREEKYLRILILSAAKAADWCKVERKAFQPFFIKAYSIFEWGIKN